MEETRPLPRGRHRLSRETVEESQRRRILDAIVELVARDGYAHTTVGEIAAQAGVSRSTFYEQFKSKEDCFRVAYDDVAARLIAAIREAAAPLGDDPPARLAAGIERYLDWSAEHPAAAATFVIEIHRAGPPALEQRSQMFQRFCEVISARRPDVRPAAVMALVTSIDAMAHECLRKGKAEQLREHLDDALYVARRLLG
jgi:AcrR family transcriptional regulator